MPVYVLLLALNLSYSLCFRNLFVLDVIFNSATHPPRFWLGMWLARRRLRMGVARSGVPVCNRHVRQPALGRSKSRFMEITSITSKILKAQSVGNQERRLRRDCLALDRESTHFPDSLHCDGVRVRRVRGWNRRSYRGFDRCSKGYG